MNSLKKFFVALRDNTDDARMKALKAIGIPVAAFAAGIILTKLNDDRVEVLVVEESHSEEPPEITTHPNEF